MKILSLVNLNAVFVLDIFVDWKSVQFSLLHETIWDAISQFDMIYKSKQWAQL